MHPPGHPGAAQIQPAEPYLVRPKNTLSATSKTPAVPPPLYDFCFRTREVCFAAHKPCSQAGVCKRVRRASSSCLEPEFLRLVLCDFSLRPVWTCPRTKVAPRLSCSARTAPPHSSQDPFFLCVGRGCYLGSSGSITVVVVLIGFIVVAGPRLLTCQSQSRRG